MSFVVAHLFLFLAAGNALVESQISESCGFRDEFENTPEKPFILPITSDNLESGESIWLGYLRGDVNRTFAGSHPHSSYAAGLTDIGKTYYRIRSNAATKTFTRKTQSRDMFRNITVECMDGSNSRYYTHIPLQDFTSPKFQKDNYKLDITPNWDLERPISDSHTIIVSDNAYEIENKPDFIRFQTSVENLIRIEPVQLWVEPFPETYHFRLNLFLISPLPPGSKTQIGLSASDDFNAGLTNIEINVSSDE